VLDSDRKLRELALGLAELGPRVLVQPEGGDFRVTSFAKDGLLSAVVPHAIVEREESLRDRDMLPGLSYDDLVTVVRRSFVSYVYTPAAEQLDYWYEDETRILK
jgi:hypothetical protein